ncbi:glycosyltransferase family 2 protein [bacterium]|nr:glycosyltransferase family 2 protein [bacterium]
MNDLISVIIPVKNGSNYIEEAIKGILSQKMNTEILVVDDCSEDNTKEIAKNLGCTVLSHETPKGQVAGKNTGIKSANGKFVLFHDHDDIMKEGALKRLYDELTSDNSFYAVKAKVQDWYSPDLSEEEKKNSPIKAEPYWGLFTGAILIKKEVFDTIGYLNETVKTGEIIEWENKMELNGFKIKKIDFVSTQRRVHSSNFGKTNRTTEFQNYASILREKLKNRK